MRAPRIFGLALVVLCLPVVVGAQEIDDWSMFHHDAQRTGLSSSQMPDPSDMEMLWSYQAHSYGSAAERVNTFEALPS